MQTKNAFYETKYHLNVVSCRTCNFYTGSDLTEHSTELDASIAAERIHDKTSPLCGNMQLTIWIQKYFKQTENKKDEAS